MVYFELPAGSVVDLPEEVENFLIGEGMANGRWRQPLSAP
jgi:hypothetical protein